MPPPTALRSSLATATSTDNLPSQPVDATPIPSVTGAHGDTNTSPPSNPDPSSISESVPGNAPAESASAQSSSTQIPSGSHCRPKYHHASEMMIARVAEWLDRERKKAGRRKVAYHHRKPHATAQPENGAGVDGASASRHERNNSIDSQSSEVSLDRLQRIIEDSMSSMGLASIPPSRPLLNKKSSGKLLRRPYSQLHRTASSDTDYADGEAVVPGCEAMLDNSKAMSYTGGSASTEDLSASTSSLSNKESRGRQAWTSFRNEVIRLAHTLRLKGWRSVPLDGGDKITVERLSGALTNAVYLVSPPKDSELVQPSSGATTPTGRKPKKLLLRVYGPNVDQLIDRETELKVLRRLAKRKIGPRVLGTFTNGRFEEYFNASALHFADLRERETSRQIAKRMRELHDGIELLESERDDGPNVWRNWDKWLDNVAKRVTRLDEIVKSGDTIAPAGVWKSNGFVCGVEWDKFKELFDKHRKYLCEFYGGGRNLRDRLVFAHNDTQYGNILRQRPDDQKSPLLQPANKHKQLIVIDFEYAAANVPGLEFANHFTEWCYNYHSETAPFACDTKYYPTPEEQHRFIKAYVEHRPQFPHTGTTPKLTPVDTPGLPQGSSTSSIVDFMLDARGGSSNWGEEERLREEKSDAAVRELREEARLWRAANSAQWVAWGIIQADIGGLEDEEEGKAGEGEQQNGNASGADEQVEAEDEFDYLSYAQERAFFFLGDCLTLGIATEEELAGVREKLKIVEY
ncbi:related to choline kinase [Cephalotrichum gorgonifer]|uniref:Related to choline kinase n=1 Tax=Cephalotrichum gorgonifer TaxID=2041049 RepID=A0AAE8MUW8_9PEZI|nr:related to choline kinase [Cephalotrichum gorgonifer]